VGEVGRSGRTKATVLGGFAGLFWASTVAFVRTLSDDLDVFRANAMLFITSGVITAIVAAWPSGCRAWIRSLAPGYLLMCGVPFVINAASLYAAIGLVKPMGEGNDRTPVIIVGLLNYLWPSLVLLLSVPIQRNRARWTLWPGALLAVGGIALVNITAGDMSWAGVKANLASNALPFGLAFVAAVMWGVYSNYSCIWHGRGAGNGVPLFLFTTGVIMALIHFARPAPPAVWSSEVVLILLYMIIFPTTLSYAFWDTAVRKGNFVVVGVVSYFTPLLSTAISAAVLKIHTNVWLWVGCALVIAGAVACKVSLKERAEERPR
jgi:drug/metabolite transporter (DMT)-like permease